MIEPQQALPTSRFHELMRPRIAQLGADATVLILHGSGGSGKSVAAAHIARNFLANDSAKQSRRVAWCQMSPSVLSDDDFWSTVLNAVGTTAADKTEGQKIARGGAYISEKLITEVFSEITSPLLLVIDDAHHAKDLSAMADLADLIVRNPHLQILLTTRSVIPVFDQIELRMSVPVRTISEEELAFNTDETEELIRQRIGSMPNEQVRRTAAAIVHESSGWPLAVHAGIVERTDPSQLESRLSKRNFANSYVNNLIHRHQGEERRLLFAIALFEEATVKVIAAVLEQPVEVIQPLLDRVAESSLRYSEDHFGERWYRHHDLIRETLRERAVEIYPEYVRMTVRSRAARAMEKVRPRVAMSLAIHAEDWDFLAHLLYSQSAVMHQVHGTTLELARVPKDVCDRYPIINHYVLVSKRMNQEIDAREVVQKLRISERREHTVPVYRPGLQAEITPGLRASVARLLANEKLALEMTDHTREGLEGLTRSEIVQNVEVYASAVTQSAVTYILAEQFHKAEAILNWFIDTLEDQQRRHPVLNHTYALLAFAVAWQGEDASEWIDNCRNREVPVGWHSSYTGAGFRFAKALERLENGQYAEAQLQLDELRPQAQTFEYWPHLALLEAHVLEATIGKTAALSLLRQRMQDHRTRYATFQTQRERLLEEQSRLMWQLGSTDAINDSATGMLGVYEALRSENIHRAGILLRDLLENSPVSVLKQAEMNLLIAYLSQRNGETDAAIQHGKRAALLMRKHALSLASRVLSATAYVELCELVPKLAQWPPLSDDHEVLSLTPSEVRTLAAIAKWGTNQKAADALFVSVNTVKSHLKSAYTKLGATNRDDAIRRAVRNGIFLKEIEE